MNWITLQLNLPELAWAALAGAGVGVLSGLFGFGGGFLVVPVLNICLGIPMPFAVGAGVCQVLGPATTSLLARRISLDDLRLPTIVAGGLLVGVFCGAQVLEIAKDQELPQSAGTLARPLTELLVLGVYFLLMLSVGLFALWDARRQDQGRPFPRGWLSAFPIPPYSEFEEVDRRRISITTLSWFGLGVGFLSGLLGMSGGLVLLPGLIYLLGLPTQRAVVSSLVIVWLAAAQSTVAHAWHENIDLALVTALLFGGTLGARLGSEHGTKLKGVTLRRAFGWLLIAASLGIFARLLYLVGR